MNTENPHCVAVLPKTPEDDHPPREQRTIERRFGLPSGRAVIGALLMTLAAVGVVVAYAGAGDDARSEYVIASRPIAAGSVLTAEDLTTARLDLDERVAGRAFRNAGELIGSVTLAPIGASEIVARSTVSRSAGSTPASELSFSIAASRALNGELRAGDLLDIYATYRDRTALVVGDVRLLSAPSSSGRGELVLRVALADAERLTELIHATTEGTVTVVRATHTRRGTGAAEPFDSTDTEEPEAGDANGDDP